MTDLAAVLLLVLSAAAGLLLIPFGLPGLWVIVLGIIGYGWLTDFSTISAGFLGLVIGLALLGELAEAWLGFRFAQRYGGSRRAGWGALLGGLVGAVVGAGAGGRVGGRRVRRGVRGAALSRATRARHTEGRRGPVGRQVGRRGGGGAQDGLGLG
jgi:hypothetical protein